MNDNSKLLDTNSPYLFEHLNDSIKWHNWSKEALELAVKEDKPIFLNIGYPTCHMCHVMSQESFSDKVIGEVLNRSFISIIVDKDIFVDVDNFFMKASIIMNGIGGWPLNILLTPDLKPFYIGTYLPKDSAGKFAGLIDVLKKSETLWHSQRERIYRAANEVYDKVKSYSTPSRGNLIDEKIFNKALHEISENWDKEYGGLKGENKFPAVHNLFFLLGHGGEMSLNLVRKQVNHMISGGIYDRLEGGFHRYTNDSRWRVPHFEKSLKDQASMIGLLAELYLYTGETAYVDCCNSTIDFIINRLRTESGCFFSGVDSDVNNTEGAYYLWEYNEIKAIMSDTEFDFAKVLFNLSQHGNFNSTVPSNVGKNILYEVMEVEGAFEIVKQDHDVAMYGNYHGLYNSVINKLKIERLKRKRGTIDNKILCDINAYTGASLIYAARIIERKDLFDVCVELEKNLDSMFLDNNFLVHFNSGDGSVYGSLQDYGYYILFLINLYQYTADYAYIKKAQRLMEIVINNFWDKTNFGFFDNDLRYSLIPFGFKQIYDTSTVPSNGVLMNILVKLYEITGLKKYFIYATNIGIAFSDLMNRNPLATISIISSLHKIKKGYLVVNIPINSVGLENDITVDDILKNTPFNVVLKYNDRDGEKSGGYYLNIGNSAVIPIENLSDFKDKIFKNKRY